MDESGWVKEYYSAKASYNMAKSTIEKHFTRLVKKLLLEDKAMEAIGAMERCPDEDVQKTLANIINYFKRS